MEVVVVPLLKEMSLLLPLLYVGVRVLVATVLCAAEVIKVEVAIVLVDGITVVVASNIVEVAFDVMVDVVI